MRTSADDRAEPVPPPRGGGLAAGWISPPARLACGALAAVLAAGAVVLAAGAARAQAGVIGPKKLGNAALVALMEKQDWGPQRRYHVDLGDIVVCDDPADAPDNLTLGSSPLFVMASRRPAVHADLFARKYQALAELGYLVLSEGAALDPPPPIGAHRSRVAPAGLRRSVVAPHACARAHAVNAALAAKVAALNDSVAANVASLPVYDMSSARIRTSYRVSRRDIIAERTHVYRIVEFAFSPRWNEGYVRIAPGLGGMKIVPRLKTIAIIGCGVPASGRSDQCDYYTADLDAAPVGEAFARLSSRAEVMDRIKSLMSRAHRKR